MTFVCFVCFTLPTNLSSVDTDILFDFLLIFSIIPSVSQLVMAILCSLPPPISFKLLLLNTSSDDGDTVSLMCFKEGFKEATEVICWSIICFATSLTFPNPTHRQLLVCVSPVSDQLASSGASFPWVVIWMYPWYIYFSFSTIPLSMCFSLFLTVTADHEHCRILQKYVEVTRKQKRANIEISHSYYRQHTVSLIKAWPPCMITSPLINMYLSCTKSVQFQTSR